MEAHDLSKEPLKEDELDRLIGSRSHLYFLNTKNELYRSRKMKENPPTRAEAIRLMAKNPNLIRRPIVFRGGQWVIGFDAAKLEEITK